MPAKTVYFSDKLHARIFKVGEAMQKDGSDVPDRKIVAAVIKACVVAHLPVLEEKYGNK